VEFGGPYIVLERLNGKVCQWGPKGPLLFWTPAFAGWQMGTLVLSELIDLAAADSRAICQSDGGVFKFGEADDYSACHPSPDEIGRFPQKTFQLNQEVSKEGSFSFPADPFTEIPASKFRTSWKEIGEKVKFFSTFCQPVGSKLF